MQTLPARRSAPALPRLEPARISGLSTAIAVHVIALGMLAMPARPPLPAPQEARTPVRWIDALPPPPPPPPVQVEVVQRPATPRPTPVPLVPRPPIDSPRNIDAPAVPTPDPGVALPDDPGSPIPAVSGNGGPGDAAPLTGAALQYRANPHPAYPREALRAGLEGTVVLQVTVDTLGNPVSVEIVSGSGHRVLDRAAREQVLRHWRFVPAMRDGRPVPAIGRIPVVFTLDG